MGLKKKRTPPKEKKMSCYVGVAGCTVFCPIILYFSYFSLLLAIDFVNPYIAVNLLFITICLGDKIVISDKIVINVL